MFLRDFPLPWEILLSLFLILKFFHIKFSEKWSPSKKSTRSSLGDRLFVPQYLVMHSRQSILYKGPKMYNDVPMEIKLLDNPESFKYNLKKIYCYNMYYIIVLVLCFIFFGETDVNYTYCYRPTRKNNVKLQVPYLVQYFFSFEVG